MSPAAGESLSIPKRERRSTLRPLEGVHKAQSQGVSSPGSANQINVFRGLKWLM